MATIFQMKQQLADLGAELSAANEEVRTKAGDPGVKMEELRELRQKQSDLKERFDILKAEVEDQEKEERAKLKRKNPVSVVENTEQRMIAAKAELYRAVFSGSSPSEETRNLLGAIPKPHTSGGDKFLPTNMTNELVSEPFARNPLREVIRMSNIAGLEVPKIAYTLDDDGFVTDEQTAKEINLTGDKVSFGKFKFKVKARVSDTVIHGSDLGLVNWIENALRSGLAAKEKKVSFAATPVSGEEHMSFYSTQNGIAEVAGEDLYEAITNSIADLHEDYRENAKVMMRFADYVTILKTLANNSATLYNAPPEQVIGKPVVFSDSATKPIVGDFNYSHLNYDPQMTYDSGGAVVCCTPLRKSGSCRQDG